MITDYKTLVNAGIILEEFDEKAGFKKCTCFSYSLYVIPKSKSWKYGQVKEKLVEHYRREIRSIISGTR